MLTNRRILDYVNAEPFRPFRIKMGSRDTYEVRHPEVIFVGRTTARVFGSRSENHQQSNGQEHEISILLIESIEVLESASPQD